METTIYKAIASSTFFLRALHNVEVDKENKVCRYTKQGVAKEVSGEKYDRLAALIRRRCSDGRGRYAMGMRNAKTRKCYVVIDRAFYDEF